MHGHLTIDLKRPGSFAEFRITSLINNLNSDRAGALSFETELFSYQLGYKRTPPDAVVDDGIEEQIVGYPRHSWSLHPSAAKKGQLIGGFTLPDHRTAAHVEATKTLL